MCQRENEKEICPFVVYLDGVCYYLPVMVKIYINWFCLVRKRVHF